MTHNRVGNVPAKRLAYYNSATRLQWTGEEQGPRTHRITTFSLICVKLFFSISAWIGDSVADPFDFLLASGMYNDIAERLSSISYVSQPHRMSKYGRLDRVPIQGMILPQL